MFNKIKNKIKLTYIKELLQLVIFLFTLPLLHLMSLSTPLVKNQNVVYYKKQIYTLSEKADIDYLKSNKTKNNANVKLKENLNSKKLELGKDLNSKKLLTNNFIKSFNKFKESKDLTKKNKMAHTRIQQNIHGTLN